MKIFQLVSVILFSVIAISVFAKKKPQPLKPEFAKWEIRSGMNISHWLSQNYTNKQGVERYAEMKESDFENLATSGFDHVRLPVDEKELWTESGEKIPYTFDLLHQAISWCKKYNLRVLVDLHIVRSHNFISENENTLFSDENAQLKMLDLWKDLADELKQYPNGLVAYEVLNEAVAPQHDMWNKLVERVVKQIRKTEPERKIFIGANRWQGVDYFQYLNVPQNDPNLVLCFHFYEPFMLTHYKASWLAPLNLPSELVYPGTISSPELEKLAGQEYKQQLSWAIGKFDVDVLDKRISLAVKRAKELGLPLYCGEFGCIYDNVPQEFHRNWFKDVVSVFKKYDIPHTVWDYKGLFKIYNEDDSPADSIVLKILVDK